MSSLDPDDQRVVALVRAETGIPDTRGPSDAAIAKAARVYAENINYWYTRVVKEAAPQYRKVVIGRISPFTKRAECDGLGAVDVAEHLVEIYSNRNFATAGGWAIEALAIAISGGQKSSAEGIDLETTDAAGNRRLYVFKSSPVTRNSDILKALKTNARQAEKLIKQGKSPTMVEAVYAVAFGVTTSTFEDGVRRPSSADLWAELTGLTDTDEAVQLVLVIVAEAYRAFSQASAAQSLQVLKTLVAAYIAVSPVEGVDAAQDQDAQAEAEVEAEAELSSPAEHPIQVDWDFLATRSMTPRKGWDAEDKAKQKRALEAVELAGLNT